MKSLDGGRVDNKVVTSWREPVSVCIRKYSALAVSGDRSRKMNGQGSKQQGSAYFSLVRRHSYLIGTNPRTSYVSI